MKIFYYLGASSETTLFDIPSSPFYTLHCKTKLFHLRNEFHFTEVCQSVNYIGMPAKRMNPKGVHVNFASDQM